MKHITEYLSYVRKNVPFYKDLPSSLDKVEILYKRAIRNNTEKLISNDYNIQQLVEEQTNGTTDHIPLKVYKSKYERGRLDLQLWAKRRTFTQNNIRRFGISYYSNDFLGKTLREKEIIKHDFAFVYIPMNHSNDIEYLNDLKRISKLGIQWLIGPISLFKKYADVCMKYRFKVNIEFCECVSEYVPDVYRKYIRDILGCNLLTQYSCHEFWGIAYSSSVNSPSLELFPNVKCLALKDKRFERELSPTIFTSTFLKAMPLVNYDVGDLIVQDGSTIYNYGYRQSDGIYLSKFVHCSVIDNAFIESLDFEFLPLEQYQIIYSQSKNSVIIISTLNESKTRKAAQMLQEILKSNGEYGVSVDYKASQRKFYRDRLTGKMRAIINARHLNTHEIW